MSFVEWMTVAALALIGVVGLYNGFRVVVTRNFSYPPIEASGNGAIGIGLLYLAGAAVALFAVWLIMLG